MSLEVIGKDCVGMLLSLLYIKDAASLAQTCKMAQAAFLSRCHWAKRLAREFGMTVALQEPTRLGKGSKKKSRAKKGLAPSLAAAELAAEYAVLHLNRRGTFRNLLTLGRTTGFLEMRILGNALAELGRRNDVERRLFVAEQNVNGKQIVSKCNFPVATVSPATNQLLIARSCGTVSLDIAHLLHVLQGGARTGFAPSCSTRPVVIEGQLPRFTERQERELIERHVLCSCGNLLWSPQDVCCGAKCDPL